VARGHEVVDARAGDVRFGAVTAAGTRDGVPFALADWRRVTWAGVA
jgi:gamma-glutamyltranspeptidase/glutathione hydrolase